MNKERARIEQAYIDGSVEGSPIDRDGRPVLHNDDDPCNCDQCMDYLAEDAGIDWSRLSPVDRETFRDANTPPAALSPERA